MSTLEYTLSNGTVLIDLRDSPTLADEVAFEHQFKLPYGVVTLQNRAFALFQIECLQVDERNKAHLEASEPLEEEPQMTEEALARSEWISFFSWRRFCRDGQEVPKTFGEFLEQVADWELKAEDEDEPESSGQSNDDIDAFAADLIDEGRGLDPTAQDPPLTQSPLSSSPVSAGPTS